MSILIIRRRRVLETVAATAPPGITVVFEQYFELGKYSTSRDDGAGIHRGPNIYRFQ